MIAWNAPADKWSEETANEMVAADYDDGVIIRKLEVYGCGFFSAQRLVKEARKGPNKSSECKVRNNFASRCHK